MGIFFIFDISLLKNYIILKVMNHLIYREIEKQRASRVLNFLEKFYIFKKELV